MRLGERVAALAALGELDIDSLASDSRDARHGALFFALDGAHTSGNLHAGSAVRAGAVAVVSEKESQPLGVPWITVVDVRAVLAAAARQFFAPLQAMRFAGVTGTNGKTTVTYLFEEIAQAAGEAVARLGTVEQRFLERHWPATHTTADTLSLCTRLEEMEKLGARWAVLEVSSHALAQKRADALRFSVSAFTNLTPDHLDFHASMGEYFAAKARLFTELTSGTAVIHTGGAFGEQMLECVRGPRLTVGRSQGDVRVARAVLERERTLLELQTPLGPLSCESALIGDFNVENLLVAIGMAIAAEFPLSAIARGIAALPGVPGRMQLVRGDDGRTGIVDYAHTPDALDRALAAIAALPHDLLYCVFGCGGDRDRAKRPLMGKAVAKHADIAVVTSDNPRSESPSAIIADILPGLGALTQRSTELAVQRGSFVVVEDRRSAIRWAAARSRPGDILLVAGKGHEDYQIVGAERRHFDDREELAIAVGGSA